MFACKPITLKPATPTTLEHYKQSNLNSTTYDFLLFYTVFTHASPNTQKEFFKDSKQSISKGEDMAAKINMATMLSSTDSAVRDPYKAQDALKECLRLDHLNADQLAYLTVLQGFIQEELRLLSKLKEESNKTMSSQQKLDALQKKNETLEQKLIDIKNIEKSLNDR
jgi:hypothetical protein